MSGFPGDLSAPLDHILHIGAGDGAELAAWQAAGAREITLVEADADTARALATRLAGQPGLRVIAGAVSADPAPRPFRITNLPALNSFRAPEGIEALFPGLRTLGREVVTPLDPVALVAGLTPGTGAAALVIEAPGEALGILQALDGAGLLDRFEAIRLQEGDTPLYAGAPPAETIRDWLHEAGFRAEFEPVPDDPDRPHLIARCDGTARKQDAEIRMLQADLAEAEAEATRQAARAEAALAERDAAEAVAERLRAERETDAAAAETMRSELARLEALASDGTALSEAREAAAGITAERDAARAEVETLRHQLGTAWQKVEERQADLKLAQQNLSVALRMQALREADLSELQDRYGALLARARAQDALLDRLAACLDAVAGPETAAKAPRKPASRRKARDG